MALYFDDVVLVTDSGVGGRKFRAAQVWAVGADTLTIRLHLEAHVLGYRVVSRALAPAAIAGDAACAEIVGTGAEDYVITALHPARFASASGSNESVARNEYSPGAVPRELHGQPRRLHWASGHLSERSAGYWRG